VKATHDLVIVSCHMRHIYVCNYGMRDF